MLKTYSGADINVVAPEIFYPVHYSQIKQFFCGVNEPVVAETAYETAALVMLQSSLALHYWHSFTQHLEIGVQSRVHEAELDTLNFVDFGEANTVLNGSMMSRVIAMNCSMT